MGLIARKSFWTAERTEMLKMLWSDPKITAADIAERIGDGLTRNAIIGKVSRLGLARRTKPGPVSKAAPKPSNPKMPPKPKPAPIAPRPIICEPAVWVEPGEPRGPLIALVDLQPHHCRWPMGDPRQSGFGFCGARKTDGSSYCAFHRAIARGVGTPSERRVCEGVGR